MSAVHPDAALRSPLQGHPLLRLTLLDRDYGMPCPTDRWQVRAAIDNLLKPALEGMVVDLEVVDATCDDVLVIGVVERDSALPKLRDLLTSLKVPAGTTLVLEGTENNLLPDLPTRDELVRQWTDSLIQMVLAESITCAPPDWLEGTLTIQCDGNWIGYKLKNHKSDNAATISGRLQGLCEEIAVLMWKNGNQWREAVLMYEGNDFNIKFSYEEPLHPIPRPAAAAPVSPTMPAARAWWKFW